MTILIARSFAAVLATVLLPLAVAGQAPGAAHGAGGSRVRAAVLEEPVVLDGVLSEPVWLSAPAATDFRQQNPVEGEPATQRTEVRFALDAEALYVGARMFDSLGAAGVRTRLGRRDEVPEGDNILLVLDTFHDHTGRTLLRVNPSGVKYDAGQATATADESWDPVWQANTQLDSLGWTAEIRIPFSQLRFPREAQQTWGLQVWRWVDRVGELSMWSFWGKQESGGPSRFGHLEGLSLPSRVRRWEILPYTVARASYVTPIQAGTPFQRGREFDWRFGADLRARVSSSTAFSGTLNPDFGQVEVDPAVVNLTAFETFYEEKRPFFVEGSGLLTFGGLSCYSCSNASGMSLFYSRRIGRTPQGAPPGSPQYSDIPENTSILGAAKVIGRARSGWQYAVLDALTASEDARFVAEDGHPHAREVEPLTNYLVTRAQRNFAGGHGFIGVMGTSVLRRFAYDSLERRLARRAEAVGVDWTRLYAGRTYELRGSFAVSQVSGDSNAILRLQRSSAHFFQRPDRGHGGFDVFSHRYDSAATSLRGHGGYLRLAKIGGAWRWEGQVNYRSPGFEVNDIAFLSRADFVWLQGNLLRRWSRPRRAYRSLELLGGGQRQYNYAGDLIDAQAHGSLFVELPNYWTASLYGRVRPETFDDRATRGGPLVRRPLDRALTGSISTDSRRPVIVSLASSYLSSDAGSWNYRTSFNIRVKPSSNVSLSLGPSIYRGRDTRQFVARFGDPAAVHFLGSRVVLADLRQREFSMSTRLGLTFSPDLSLEIFAQPFVSSGLYSRFKEYVGPRSSETQTFSPSQLRVVPDAAGRDSLLVLDPDEDPATPSFSFPSPEFHVRSLRGNAVLRWEYRPGSTIYLVWQQQRAGNAGIADFELSRAVGEVFDSRPDNVFVLKASYWLNR
jgi:hypothetical protein